jgi:hypothetical protein
MPDDHVDIVSFEPDGSYWISCWACGGMGFYESDCTCCDDTCCCLVPEPPSCSECKGTGSLGPIKVGGG